MNKNIEICKNALQEREKDAIIHSCGGEPFSSAVILNNMWKAKDKMKESLCNSYLLVDLAALRRNAEQILSEIGEGVELIPVLKDNAYGLGAVAVAQELCTLPAIHWLAVSNLSEGLIFREAGIGKQILVTGNCLPFQMEAAVAADLTLACGRLGMLRELAESAKKLGKRAKFQLKVDTGLHRIGIEPDELEDWSREYRECEPWLSAEGVFSHFSNSNCDSADETEFQLFQQALEKLRSLGIEFPLCHIAASATVEQHPQYFLNGVRVGRRLYMDKPSETNGAIAEVASWRSYITNLKPRHKGDYIGYGGKVQLTADTVVATVGVGYGDGLNQDLVQIGGPVLVSGKRCRLLSSCMDQCLVDVGAVSCRVGDEVTFYGYDGKGNFLSSQEVAAMVNNDEGCGLTTALSSRVARVYTGGTESVK